MLLERLVVIGAELLDLLLALGQLDDTLGIQVGGEVANLRETVVQAAGERR